MEYDDDDRDPYVAPSGTQWKSEADRLRAEVECLRWELVLAIDEAEHGHCCSFCGCDLTGAEPWTHSKDCMVNSMRDALTREGGEGS